MALNYEKFGELYEDLPERHSPKRPSRSDHKNHLRADFQKELQEKAERTIKKHLKSQFENLDETEKKKKTEAYFEWLSGSIKQKYPLFEEEDLTRKEGDGWVNLVHEPTLFGVHHSGEENMHLNNREAEIELYNILDTHIKYWAEASNGFKRKFGIAIS